jgi:hypothetical protein
MKYAKEMGSCAMTYTPSLISTGSSIQNLMGGYTDSMVTTLAYYYFFKIRKVGQKSTTYFKEYVMQ